MAFEDTWRSGYGLRSYLTLWLWPSRIPESTIHNKGASQPKSFLPKRQDQLDFSPQIEAPKGAVHQKQEAPQNAAPCFSKTGKLEIKKRTTAKWIRTTKRSVILKKTKAWFADCAISSGRCLFRAAEGSFENLETCSLLLLASELIACLAVAIACLFIAIAYLFIAITYLFIAVACLFIAIAYLFIAVVCLFIATACLAVETAFLATAIACLFFRNCLLIHRNCLLIFLEIACLFFRNCLLIHRNCLVIYRNSVLGYSNVPRGTI